MANWDRPTLRDVTEGDVDTGKALLGRLFIENEEPTEHNGRVAIKFDGRCADNVFEDATAARLMHRKATAEGPVSTMAFSVKKQRL